MPRYAAYDPTRCLNCGANFPSETHYCPTCGQRNRSHKRSLLEWATEGLSTFLHLEGRTWNTVRDIWVPGRLARNYLNGQRQRYLHPLRLLLFSSLFCFTAVQFAPEEAAVADSGTPVRAEAMGAGDDSNARPADADHYEKFVDDLTDDIDDGTASTAEAYRALRSAREVLAKAPLDSVERQRLLSEVGGAEAALAEERRERVFGVATESSYTTHMRTLDRVRMRLATSERIGALADSAQSAGHASTPETAALLDSFRTAFPPPSGTFISGNLFGESASVTTEMYARLTPEQLVDSSRLERWYNRLILRKSAHLAQEGNDSITAYLLSQLSWAVLLFVPMLAFGYWVLYHRRLPYYSQHLSLVAINAGFGLLLFGLGTLLWSVTLAEWVVAVCTVGLLGYVFAAEMRVYEYVWWKTLLKDVALLVYGTVALGVAAVLWLTLVVLLH